MRIFCIILLVLSSSMLCFGGGDTLSAKRFGKQRNKATASSNHLIQKMSDEQLLMLIDHMFEASNIPTDLWNEVMIETAKRNLGKLNRTEFAEAPFENKKNGELYIEKIVPDSVSPFTFSEMDYHPASQFYSEWDEDLSSLFKETFSKDTSIILELENSEFGCFNMPSWGPVSSTFGWRHKKYHKGIDIQLRKGDTIVSAFDGMIRFAKRKGGYGNLVIVRHYNGLETVYAHLSKIKVQEGQVVAAGELLGLAGSTGKSTGPHLHFEVRFMGVPVNPQYIMSFDYGNLLMNTVVFKKNKNGFLSAFHPETEFHDVQKGETFSELANHYGTTVAKLRELNGFPPKSYIRMKQGMVIRVRESQTDCAGKLTSTPAIGSSSTFAKP